MGDVATARAAAVAGIAVQDIDASGIDWLDPDTIVVRTIPKRGAAPTASVPTGPVVQESFGRKSPERASFADFIDGRPQTFIFSGEWFVRRDI